MLPQSFYPDPPPGAVRFPASVVLVDPPPSAMQWHGCGTTEDMCSVNLQPALNAAVVSILKDNFQNVRSSADLESATRGADLMALEDITMTPAYGVADGYIRVTLMFKDPHIDQIVTEVSSVAKIHLPPVMWSPKHAVLVLVDFATMDLFLPVHGYIANRDGLAELSDAIAAPLADAVANLSHQMKADDRIVQYVAALPSQVDRAAATTIARPERY